VRKWDELVLTFRVEILTLLSRSGREERQVVERSIRSVEICNLCIRAFPARILPLDLGRQVAVLETDDDAFTPEEQQTKEGSETSKSVQQ
jgi:hypothetical protein